MDRTLEQAEVLIEALRGIRPVTLDELSEMLHQWDGVSNGEANDH